MCNIIYIYIYMSECVTLFDHEEDDTVQLGEFFSVMPKCLVSNEVSSDFCGISSNESSGNFPFEKGIPGYPFCGPRLDRYYSDLILRSAMDISTLGYVGFTFRY